MENIGIMKSLTAGEEREKETENNCLEEKAQSSTKGGRAEMKRRDAMENGNPDTRAAR